MNYRCASCGKQHVMDAPVEQAFETKCLRCGAAITVTPEVLQPSPGRSRTPGASAELEDSISKNLSKKAASVAAKGESKADAGDDSGPSTDNASPSAGNGEKQRKQKADGEGAKTSDKKTGATPRPSKQTAWPERKVAMNRDDSAEQPRWPPPKPAAGLNAKPGEKKPRPRWQLIAAIATAVLVVGGVGGYLIFGGKKAPPKQAAKAPAPKPKPTTQPAPKKVEPPPPPPKTPPKVDFAISAPRLSEELAANAAETNAIYANKVLEVSGLFAKIEQKDGLRPPPHPHAVFVTEGSAVSCDLQGSRTDLKTWSGLPVNQPCSVRGIYGKDGFLHDCFLMPFTPSADAKYKGNTIEVVGHVQEVLPPSEKQVFPAIKLEGETNSTWGLLCFFRKTDAEEVQKIRKGSPVTVQGACSGRYVQDKLTSVRLDNSQLVYTSAPPAGIARVEAARLLRDYEEDLHAFCLPAPGAEDRIQTPLLIKQLAEELAADPKVFTKKYRNRVLTVLGKSLEAPKDHTLILESGDTNGTLKIRCRFGARAFEGVDKRNEYRITGLCTAMPDARTLVLDNCEIHDPAVKKGPALTADFLPHAPGKSITYDIAGFGVRTSKKTDDVVRREIHHQSENGLTETLVTHTGPLIGKSLFEEDEQEKWIAAKKTKKVRALMPGPVYYHRLSAGFVEIGEPEEVGTDKDKKVVITWAPVLKLGVQVGGKWSWDPPTGEHDYVLEKFDEYRGRPSAVIREKITRSASIMHPIEILHVYVKGIGEVERHEWMHINKRGDKRLLLEKKLVEPPSTIPGRTAEGGAGRREPKGPGDLKAKPPAPK